MFPVGFKTSVVRTLAAAVILLVAGSLVGAAVLWRTSAIPVMASPPCHDCSAIYSSGQILDADVCGVGASLDLFRDQLVRVRGTFRNDACYTSLRVDSCPNDFIRVGLSRDVTACSGTQKALAIYTGFGEWYDGPPVTATLVGRIREIQNQNSCERDQLGLDILCLESVIPLGGIEPPRSHYAIGRVLDLIFGVPKT